MVGTISTVHLVTLGSRALRLKTTALNVRCTETRQYTHNVRTPAAPDDLCLSLQECG